MISKFFTWYEAIGERQITRNALIIGNAYLIAKFGLEVALSLNVSLFVFCLIVKFTDNPTRNVMRLLQVSPELVNCLYDENGDCILK